MKHFKNLDFSLDNGPIQKAKRFFLCFLGFVLIFSCEKDDICVDGDTPLLIIRFYDAADTTQFKSVSSLRVIGLGQETPVDTFTDRSTLDSIGIPLRINEISTGFQLILDSADDDDELETGNSDTLNFNYTTQEVFVSRACGFIANYEGLSDELTSDSENWIQSIEIVNPSITNQNSAHVKIFH